MAYSDFLTQVRYALEEPTANVWADSRIMTLTNRAIRDIQSKTGLTSDRVVADSVASQQSYDLPDNTLRVNGVDFVGHPLERLSVSTLFSMYHASPADGDPMYYAVGDDVLFLFPTPATVGEMRIHRTRASDAITATTDAMPFGGLHDDAIELYVLAKCFEQTNDWQTAGEYMTRYQGELTAIESEDAIADSGYTSEPVQTY